MFLLCFPSLKPSTGFPCAGRPQQEILETLDDAMALAVEARKNVGFSYHFTMKNSHFTMKTCDFTMNNCDFTMKNCDFTMEKWWFPVSFNGDFMIWWWFNGMFFGNNDDLIGYFTMKKKGFGGFYSNGDLMMIWWWFYLREIWQEYNSIGVLVEAKSPCNWKHAGPSMMGLWWDFTIKHWFHVLSSWFISLLTNRLTIGFIVDIFFRCSKQTYNQRALSCNRLDHGRTLKAVQQKVVNL